MSRREESAAEAPDVFTYSALLEATQPINLNFYTRPAREVAPDLLSCVLFHNETAGMIVETEAYLGAEDLAAHAARGRTERTRVLFGPPGTAYVYFIYGMHECLNVVAEPEGSPGCVLIRALAPLTGLAEMRKRRSWKGPSLGLTNGPGKLTQALGITRQHYGRELNSAELSIRQWHKKPQFRVAVTPRIGITKCADWPLRFIWEGHPCLSR